MTVEEAAATRGRVAVRPLRETDLPEASRIFRVAFGTFLGAPDPEAFLADRDYVSGRFHAPNVVSLAATVDGTLAGSNFVTNWGSVGFFGPLTVRPDMQERGIGQALLAPTMEQFDAWGTRHAGLFTFAHSAKHIALYRKFGFYPRFLTAIMTAPTTRATAAGWTRFSMLPAAEREEALRQCRAVAESIYPGLDLSAEIAAMAVHGLGDVVMVEGSAGIVAFAICHHGPRSEADANALFIKFGAVSDGPSAARDYERLLDACESLAVEAGMGNVAAGVNLSRREAYEHLGARGYRTAIQGVAMHRDNDPGYCRPGVYVVDDWR